MSATLVTGRRPQLDGLRALAVTAVLVHHLWDGLPHLVAEMAHQGVRLFFVLSGFLITRGLLRARIGGRTGGETLRHFWARRFLRLLPPYYLTLAMMLALDMGGIRDSAVWHLAHASNIWFAWSGTWDPWVANHFWSLAVEEQFYLLWPLFAIFLPWRALLPAALLAVALAPLARGLGTGWGANDMAMLGLLPMSFDALGIGAVLAILGPRAGCRPVWVGAMGLIPVLCLPWLELPPPLSAALNDLLWAVPLGALVVLADRGMGGWPGRILGHSWSVEVGRISYGIYLYHPVLMWLAADFALRTGLFAPLSGVSRLLVLAPVTVLLAALSYRRLEEPLMRLMPGGSAGYAVPTSPAPRSAAEPGSVSTGA